MRFGLNIFLGKNMHKRVKDGKNAAHNKQNPFSWLPPTHPAIAAYNASNSSFYKDLYPSFSTIPFDCPQQLVGGVSGVQTISLSDVGEGLPPLVIRGERLSHLHTLDGKPVYQESVLMSSSGLLEALELPPRDDRANKDSAIIDTCSATIKISRYHEYAEFFGDEEMIELISRDLQMALGLKVGVDVNPKNFYKNTCELRHISSGVNYKNLGFVAWGGNRDTINIHITGEGCEHVTFNGLWERYAKYLELLEAKITRADLAFDDLNGDYTVDMALEWYKEGGFNSGGRSPVCSANGDWFTGNDLDGRTFYVGKRENGKQMCVYEKGKQLKSACYPDWVRFEGRLGSRGRIIPYDVLVNAGQYLSAMYPCLGFVSDKQVKIKTIIKAKVKSTVERGVENCRFQYGSYILAARSAGISDTDLCEMLVVDKDIPKNLVYPPSVDENFFPEDIGIKPKIPESYDEFSMKELWDEVKRTA